VAGRSASGPKVSLIPDIRPRVLPILFSGTATAGAAGSLTLATNIPAVTNLLAGCILRTTGGTGGGGANNQARVIIGFSITRLASVTPNWEVTPDNTTTYEVLLTETAYTALSDLFMIGGDEASLSRFKRAIDTEALVTVGPTPTPTVTAIPTSTLIPAATATDQFKGRVLLFDRATSSPNLRGQGTKITANTTAGLLTVEALSHPPQSGDIAIIV
jgi:hypothetical protein